MDLDNLKKKPLKVYNWIIKKLGLSQLEVA